MLFSNLKNADRQMKNRQTNIFAVLIVVLKFTAEIITKNTVLKPFSLTQCFRSGKFPAEHEI